MSRNMWILAAVIGVLALAMIYQSELGGGVDRPWAACKENVVRQMLFGDCTPRTPGISLPGTARE